MRKILSLLLLFVICVSLSTASAQPNTNHFIRGKITDSTTGTALKAATVTLLNIRDTTVVTKISSLDDGTFKINRPSNASYMLRITFTAFDTLLAKIDSTKTVASIDLGTLSMCPATNELATVVITSVYPVTIKQDTVEFNAAAYTTKPNAVAEDLIKKMPGMEVGSDGAIKAQGEDVQRILVDGKRFFGNDTKMATQNLPTDVIDKIAVYDAMSDQSVFSGMDDGNRIKTINIITKKDKRKGYFGKAMAGIGNKGLYGAATNLSKFDDNQQITLIGKATNANRQFSVESGGGGGRSGGGRSGGGRSGGGGGDGFMTTYSGGINYKDVWSPKTEVSGSYAYSKTNVDREQTVNKYTLNLDSSSVSNRAQISDNNNQDHRFNFNIETKLDSTNELVVRPSFSFQNSNNTSLTTTDIKLSKFKGAETEPISQTATKANSKSETYNGDVDMTYRHRFRKKGRTVSVNLILGANSTKGSGNTYSMLNFIQRNDSTETNQFYNSTSSQNSINTTLSYTEPIAKNQTLEANYNYAHRQSNSGRYTYGYDSITNTYSMVNENQTNDFENTYSSNRATLNYRIQSEKINFTLGSGVLLGHLHSFNKSKNTTTEQHYVNMFPTATFRYNPDKTKNLRFNYSGRTSQPGVTQLQPLIDSSDLLNVRSGNPDLQQQFSHSFRIMYNSFDKVTQKSLFASMNMNFTNNAIVNTITNMANGGQYTKPINANGNYNIDGNVSVGIPVKVPKSTLNFSTNVSHSQSISFIKGRAANQSDKNINRNYSFGETIRWNTNLRDNFDMNFSISPSYNITTYSLRKDQNDKYFSQQLSTDATYYTHNGWIVSSDFSYYYYGGGNAGGRTNVPLWNAGLAKQLFRDKAGELKFSIFDLLNQNVSVSHSTIENNVQDTYTKTLTRYFLLSFTYNLRKFGTGGQQERPRGMPADRRWERGGGASWRGIGGV